MNILARFAGFGRGRKDAVDETAGTEPQARVAEVERRDSEKLREPIVSALRGVFDPEIPVNIYDLGLIYRVDIAGNGNVHIEMTLTAPACPVAGMMPRMVEDAVKKVEGVGEVLVDLVWEPAWTRDRMTEEALLQLGML